MKPKASPFIKNSCVFLLKLIRQWLGIRCSLKKKTKQESQSQNKWVRCSTISRGNNLARAPRQLAADGAARAHGGRSQRAIRPPSCLVPFLKFLRSDATWEASEGALRLVDGVSIYQRQVVIKLDGWSHRQGELLIIVQQYWDRAGLTRQVTIPDSDATQH